MKLLLLGTGGYHPSELRHTACLMLPTEGIILDAGTAMFRVRDHIQTDSLEILLSHAHLDHIVGLTFLFDVLHKKNVDRVTTRVAKEKISPIQNHLFAEELFPVAPPCDFVEIESKFGIGNCTVRTIGLEHPGGSTGFRLDWPDRSMAYITDTVAAEDAEYVSFIENVDLLVHECYFPDGFERHARLTGHSTATAVAKAARQSNAKELILVHVNPIDNVVDPINLASVQQIFPHTRLGNDGMEVDF